MSFAHTYFIAGHARLPQGMAAKNVYDTLTITAEIDRKYGVIIQASCTLATSHGRDFVGELLRGISLKDGIEEPIRLLQQHYRGRAIHALTAALRDLYAQFEQLGIK
ncbi:DUF3870 domain-containing protein [Thermoflavimicrobium dichotomicum]|uniref:DUF3870 domain-containing protein n=1 Tax=Thermoflavimicrobium dichotomicum TaxID=46223 RepID=A0A1I3US50_9BACL|nr:DUF3870 domain-containing protein [Thermoflavimicrobium dichotomicum]SFJ85745.1 protein of unknown function [Thermoflavimicrobium dichotomicum]